eukprot:TRINITY_DN32985_c0_g1_i2.p1 TRINITY_DN32985_c0_g1~~TRINITY_DN32985_c0_g1_i2.p1  ORF type:complete len:720 (-),score=99.59 TRINITY_DN32985_c0_g1_i2:130-2289(-)
MGQPIAPREVIRALKGTKAMTAAGPDGVAAHQIKMKCGDGVLLSIIFNTWLTSRKIPPYLKESRSILLPKTKQDLDKIGNWRPLTIGSVLTRLYAKILAKRLSEQIPLNPMQRGFIPAPGVSENTVLLKRIIREAKQKRGTLAVAFLDLAKAFDTVSHDLVQKGMKRFGIPEHLCEVVGDMYKGATTRFQVKGGETGPLHIRSGVKQGDPLSPILFDMAMDPLFCLLEEEGKAWKTESGTTVVAMGYADDTAVLSRSLAGMKRNLRLVSRFCDAVGLKLNVKKSYAFTIKASRKTYTVNEGEPFMVSGQQIPWVGPDQSTKYLGKQFGPWVGLERPELLQQLKVWSENIRCAPLKPEQKIEIWRETVIPRLVSSLVNSGPPKIQLIELDNAIRKGVKACLRLPDQTTDQLLYTSMRRGGLGLLQIEMQVPRLETKALKGLVNTKDEYIAQLAEALKIPQEVREAKPDCTPRYHHKWAEQPVQGKGVETWAYHPVANHWLKGQTLSSGEFIAALQVRTNTYPTRECISRYTKGLDVRCRRCGSSVETIGHISGACQAVKKARIKRHESICTIVANKAAGKGWEVKWEPTFLVDGASLRPDLILVKGNTIILVDPTVIWDSSKADLDKARKIKRTKYECLRQTLAEEYLPGVEKPEIIIEGLPVGARGGWTEQNDRLLEKMGVNPKGAAKAISIRAIGGTLRLLQIFMDVSWRQADRVREE